MTNRNYVIEALRAAASALSNQQTLMGYVIDAKTVVFDDKKYAALNHLPAVQEMLFKHRDMLGGLAAVRLDIPSSNKRGIVVVTVHELNGKVRGYDHSAVVGKAHFKLTSAMARNIAKGEKPPKADGTKAKQNKKPFSYVAGRLLGAGSEGKPAKPTGIPVYYDPQVVHLYVDARNGLPLKGAGKVNFHYKNGGGYYLPEIDGIYIWAESPIYYGPGEAPGATLGADGGKWDWVQDTIFKKTGEKSKVVMP